MSEMEREITMDEQVEVKEQEAAENANVIVGEKPKESKKESKAEKFVRLAEQRTDKALKAISNLAGLANTGSYEYTSEQAEYIFSTLEETLQEVKKKFEAKGGKNKKESFSFCGMKKVEVNGSKWK